MKPELDGKPLMSFKQLKEFVEENGLVDTLDSEEEKDLRDLFYNKVLKKH